MRKTLVAAFLSLIAIWLLFLSLPFSAAAQQPIATVTGLQGTVLVTAQGQSPKSASVGTVVRAGDSVETLMGSLVVLTLSEGSELRFGQNTKVEVALLAQRPGAKARQSRLKLAWGKLRAILSPGHQAEGSSFEVETPNTLAGVKFSQPIIDVEYDPLTDVTIVDAYTVDVMLQNLRTQEVRRVSKGERGIVRRQSMSTAPGASQPPTTPPPERKPPEESQHEQNAPPTASQETTSPPLTEPQTTPAQQRAIKNISPVLLQTRNSVRRSTSTSAPASIGTVGTHQIDGIPDVAEEKTSSDDDSAREEDATTQAGETTTSTTPGESTAGGIGGGAETSTNPSPGARPSRPDKESRTVIISVEEQ